MLRQADGEDFAAAARVGGVAAAAAAVVFDRLLAVPELPDVATRPAVGQSHQLERHAQVAQSGHARTDPQVAGEQNQRVDPLFGTKKNNGRTKIHSRNVEKSVAQRVVSDKDDVLAVTFFCRSSGGSKNLFAACKSGDVERVIECLREFSPLDSSLSGSFFFRHDVVTGPHLDTSFLIWAVTLRRTRIGSEHQHGVRGGQPRDGAARGLPRRTLGRGARPRAERRGRRQDGHVAEHGRGRRARPGPQRDRQVPHPGRILRFLEGRASLCRPARSPVLFSTSSSENSFNIARSCYVVVPGRTRSFFFVLRGFLPGLSTRLHLVESGSD